MASLTFSVFFCEKISKFIRVKRFTRDLENFALHQGPDGHMPPAVSEKTEFPKEENFPLLISQCLSRIELRGSPGRIERGHETDEDGRQYDKNDIQGVDLGREFIDIVDIA